MTIEFRVIGERREDPGHLLLVDDEGRPYDYDLVLDEIVPIELDSTWNIDFPERKALVIEAPAEMVAV